MTPVILSEITSGPLHEASYTADRPRNQLQHAPTKPYSFAGCSVAPDTSPAICCWILWNVPSSGSAPAPPGGEEQSGRLQLRDTVERQRTARMEAARPRRASIAVCLRHPFFTGGRESLSPSPFRLCFINGEPGTKSSKKS